ncbi:MAG: hypothetical protein DME25_18635 [Verrucomicrobia bacterium]|nr:MAG: hypothetical protein DME25_18635 [Verrucomicrobiota bacterium]
MKKLLAAFLGLACAVALTVNAGEGKKDHPKLTKEERQELKALREKYDANKDGKLDKEERAKMSKEDKEKFEKLTGHGEKKGESKEKENK